MQIKKGTQYAFLFRFIKGCNTYQILQGEESLKAPCTLLSLILQNS